ncbi:MAG: host-nuclease inhibitor Gam family protein [Xanthobacteraceae bacterium]
MRKARKQKPEAIVVRDRGHAMETVARVGAMQRAIAALEADLNNNIAAAAEKSKKLAEAMQAKLGNMIAGLEDWCDAHRGELTEDGKSKSADLGTGTVGWRDRPPSVKLRGKIEDVLVRILGERAPRSWRRFFIRTKYELNKEAMLARPELAAQIDGVTIVTGKEDFFVEPLEADIAEDGA